MKELNIDKTRGFCNPSSISAKERTTLNEMPALYKQDGKGRDAIVYAHYYIGGYDFWCTECSAEGDDVMMFGLTHLHDTELGYTSLKELKEIRVHGIFPVEFDMYWEPCRLADLKDEHAKEWVRIMYGAEPEPEPTPDPDPEPTHELDDEAQTALMMKILGVA